MRRLEKTCDKYSRQLEEARAENVELKAQLLESTKFQVRSKGNTKYITKAENSV